VRAAVSCTTLDVGGCQQRLLQLTASARIARMCRNMRRANCKWPHQQIELPQPATSHRLFYTHKQSSSIYSVPPHATARAWPLPQFTTTVHHHTPLPAHPPHYQVSRCFPLCATTAMSALVPLTHSAAYISHNAPAARPCTSTSPHHSLRCTTQYTCTTGCSVHAEYISTCACPLCPQQTPSPPTAPCHPRAVRSCHPVHPCWQQASPIRLHRQPGQAATPSSSCCPASGVCQSLDSVAISAGHC
jgi:hypothetical protein